MEEIKAMIVIKWQEGVMKLRRVPRWWWKKHGEIKIFVIEGKVEGTHAYSPPVLQFMPHLSFHLPDLLPACPLFFLQCAARKRDLCWVWTHRCCVYCPKLKELALKATSRVLEEDVAHAQRKKNKTRLACIFIYWRGEGVGGGHLIAAKLHPFLWLWLIRLMTPLPQ